MIGPLEAFGDTPLALGSPPTPLFQWTQAQLTPHPGSEARTFPTPAPPPGYGDWFESEQVALSEPVCLQGFHREGWGQRGEVP
jgi:hypothetical protein